MSNPTTGRYNLRAIMACVGTLMFAAPFALAETYNVTHVNPPAGATSSSADGVNASGLVVGNTSVKSGRSEVTGPAFVWSNGVAQALPSPAGSSGARANAVSDIGLIVGNFAAAGAIWWQSNGTGGYSVGSWNGLLPAGSTLNLVNAVAVSTDGQFVLFDQVDTATGHDQAAVARVNFDGCTPVAFSAFWLIDSLDGSVSSDGFVSAGMDITHDGNGVVRVSGFAGHQGALARAFLWQNDLVSGTISLTDLDPTQTGLSTGDGVNNNGEVAGNGGQAYFWNAAGAKQQLPTLGGARSYATALSDDGFVVGWSQRSGKNAANHAFIWSAATGLRDLNSLKAGGDISIELTSASAISNSGRILARGLKKSAGVNALLTRNP